MSINQVVKVSLQNLISNKIRAFLTMFGVIIGVFSVIVLVSIGTGIENFIVGEFAALGSNLAMVSPGKVDLGDDPAKYLTRNKLDQKHLELINTYASDYVEELTPSVRLNEISRYKTKSFSGTVIGGSDRVLHILNLNVEDGRFFTRQEVRSKAKVAVIGPLVRKELFGSGNPVGNTITVGDERFEVIGTFEEKGLNFDDNIVAPYTTVQEVFNVDNFSNIALKLKDTENVDVAIRQVELALLRDLKEDDFTVLSQEDILQSIQNILRILTIGIGSIAGISLVVGGIGIMNIMLVSVTERTSEIGLKKALGATSRNIAFQFLFESVFISVSGGIIGLILSWLGTLAIRTYIDASIPGWAVLLALSFSVSVGALFGTYPAIQASKKDPIEALRYE